MMGFGKSCLCLENSREPTGNVIRIVPELDKIKAYTETKSLCAKMATADSGGAG